MVVTFFPATLAAVVEQERVGAPFTWTVQAPHSAIPQPNLVPVIPSVSRSTHNRGMSLGTFTLWDRPFKLNVIAGIPASLRDCSLQYSSGFRHLPPGQDVRRQEAQDGRLRAVDQQTGVVHHRPAPEWRHRLVPEAGIQLR